MHAPWSTTFVVMISVTLLPSKTMTKGTGLVEPAGKIVQLCEETCVMTLQV